MELYKYMAPQRSEVLRDRLLRFTPPSRFNDPFESTPLLRDDLTPEEWRRIAEVEAGPAGMPAELVDEILAPENLMAIMPKALEVLGTLLRSSVGVLALTERRDNLVMWAHYAAEHRGFVIELDSDNPWFERADRPRLNVLAQVTYAAQRPAEGLKTLSIEDTYFRKSPHWSYENEWRVFRSLDAADRVLGSQDNAVHLFEFPSSLIKSVILGCRCPPDTVGDITQLLAKPWYEHVALLRARVHETEYRLVIEPARFESMNR